MGKRSYEERWRKNDRKYSDGENKSGKDGMKSKRKEKFVEY